MICFHSHKALLRHGLMIWLRGWQVSRFKVLMTFDIFRFQGLHTTRSKKEDNRMRFLVPNFLQRRVLHRCFPGYFVKIFRKDFYRTRIDFLDTLPKRNVDKTFRRSARCILNVLCLVCDQFMYVRCGKQIPLQCKFNCSVFQIKEVYNFFYFRSSQ